MIDWPLALSTASQTIKLANHLPSLHKEFSQTHLKLKVADLTTALADLKLTLTEAKTDAAEKDAEITRLKTLQRRLTEDTVELYGYRYRTRSDGNEGGAGNPFCGVCLQKDGLLIETAYVPGKGIMAVQYPNCKALYGRLPTYTH